MKEAAFRGIVHPRGGEIQSPPLSAGEGNRREARNRRRPGPWVRPRIPRRRAGRGGILTAYPWAASLLTPPTVVRRQLRFRLLPAFISFAMTTAPFTRSAPCTAACVLAITSL